MFGNYMLLFSFAHLISDFLIQTDNICAMKITKGKMSKGLGLHIFGVFITQIIIFLLFLGRINPSELLCLFFISITHYIIDLFKSRYTLSKKNDHVVEDKREKFNLTTEEITIKDRISYDFMSIITNRTKTIKSKNKKEEEISRFNFSNIWIINSFFLDQIAHFLIIIIISLFLVNPPNVLLFIQDYIIKLANFYFLVLNNTVKISESLILIKKELLVCILLLMATSVSSVVIKTIMQGITNGDSANIKSGRYIGQLERVLTIFIILAGAWHALAVLYGSKTAIRFEQAKEDPEFAEYYILGTLLSALFGTLIAITIKFVFF